MFYGFNMIYAKCRDGVEKALHFHPVASGLKAMFRLGHVAYFGVVALEAHGFYAFIGGILGVLLILNFIGHFDVD